MYAKIQTVGGAVCWFTTIELHYFMLSFLEKYFFILHIIN